MSLRSRDRLLDIMRQTEDKYSVATRSGTRGYNCHKTGDIGMLVGMWV